MPEQPRCATCKWWGMVFSGYCERVDHWQSPGVFEVIASADDDSNLQAGLKTGPDFGCVLHEPLEVSDAKP